MEASIIDLRYHMNDVLKALRRNEDVKVFYHGKIEAILSPVVSQNKRSVREHPFCGMLANEKTSVAETMKKLRGFRYDSL